MRMRLLFILLILFNVLTGSCQEIAKSQKGSVSQYISQTVVTVKYSRPVARGRDLFGGIVDWNEVWCPGADTATTISVSTAVKINGQNLPAGTYSVWAIPNPDEWTVMLSTVPRVFHTRYPGRARDALRLSIAPTTGAHMETMSYYFPWVEGREADLVFHWGTVVVPFRFEVP